MAKGECPTKIKYKLINQLKSKYTVSLLCKIANVSRSGYYKWFQGIVIPSETKLHDEELKKVILKVYNKFKGIYGYRRIQVYLDKKMNIKLNHKKVYRLMKELNIKSKIRSKRKYFAACDLNIVEDNILNRDFKADKPRNKIVTDVTVLKYNKNKKLYLSVMMDLFNNEILSFNISKNNNNDLVMKNLFDTLSKYKLNYSILHSDRGHQYTSNYYNQTLKNNNIIQSMSRKGNCHDNACVENFFGHLKSELMYINNFFNEDEVRGSVKKYINFYNKKRFQKKLNNMAPIEYRRHVQLMRG